MGIFDGMKDAKVFENGRKLPPGDHVVKILECLVRQSAQHGNQMFICEYELLSSTSPEAQVGGKYSWVQHLKDINVAKSALKQFVLAVMQADEQRNKEHFDQCVAACEAQGQAAIDKGAFNGCYVRVSTNKTITAKAKQEFNRHTFYPYFDSKSA